LGRTRCCTPESFAHASDLWSTTTYPTSRCTRLETGDGGGSYRFVSLDGGFSADLPVDLDGLVMDYPGLFRRAFP
jgi:uncharacterized protein